MSNLHPSGSDAGADKKGGLTSAALRSGLPSGSRSRMLSRKRQATRERIHQQVLHPIDTPRLLRDPLERRESRALSAIAAIRLSVGAAIIHGLVIVGFAVVSHMVGEPRAVRAPERLKVSIIQPPPLEVPPVVEPPKVEGEVVPEFTPRTPPKVIKPQPNKVTAAPVAVQAEAPSEPAARRVVGLSFESTVEGNGPAFATGSTRMGSTEKQAADPKLAAKPATVSAPATRGEPLNGSVQRLATRIPTRDVEFTEPKRLGQSKPEYPPTLKAQGVEGDVMVSVDIAASGEVTRASVVRGSGYAEFDESARVAALKSRYSPAQRNGQSVAFTLSYTYRFRIED